MEATIEAGRKWLGQCLKEHDSCRKKANVATVSANGLFNMVRDIDHENRMPRRLLWIDPGTGNQHLNLVEIGKTTKQIPYVALSHRWGSLKTLKTTQANINEFKCGMRPSDLPRTFRAAVRVTRGLGYEYLWIDSLCIVQDDPHDWKDEAPRMALVERVSGQSQPTVPSDCPVYTAGACATSAPHLRHTIT